MGGRLYAGSVAGGAQGTRVARGGGKPPTRHPLAFMIAFGEIEGGKSRKLRERPPPLVCPVQPPPFPFAARMLGLLMEPGGGTSILEPNRM